MRHDGSGWKTEIAPVGQSITAIYAQSDDNVWASVRTLDESPLYDMYHWSGDAWVRSNSEPLPAPVLSFAQDPQGRIWAVGGKAGLHGERSRQLILAWESDEWRTIVDRDGGVLRDVYFDDTGIGWTAGGLGQILRFDGTEWRDAHTTMIGPYGISDITSIGESVWFLGDVQFVEHVAGEFRYWGGEQRPWGVQGITSIAVLGDGSGWAAGWGGPLLKRSGESWTAVKDAPHFESAITVEALAANDVWVSFAMPGIIAHFDGVTWTEYQLPTDYHIRSVSVVGHESVWALATPYLVGLELENPGADIFHFNGEGWQKSYSTRTETVRGMSFAGELSGWAVGDEFLEYGGAGWQVRGFPEAFSGHTMVDVDMSGPGTGWLLSLTSAFEYSDSSTVEHDLLAREDVRSGRVLNGIRSDGAFVVVAGSEDVFARTDTGWDQISIPIARRDSLPYIGLELLEYMGQKTAWIAGRFETIARIEFAALVESPTPSVATSTPVATASLTARPSETTPRASLFVPQLRR